MNQNQSSLTAIYRRRALCTKLALALTTVGVGAAPLVTAAQDTVTITPGGTAQKPAETKPAAKKPKQDTKKTQKTNPKKGQATNKANPNSRAAGQPNIRVIPMPGQGNNPGQGGNPGFPFPGGGRGGRGGFGGRGFGGQGRGFGGPGGMGNFGGMGNATRISFDFRGSDIMNVLRFYSQITGTTITVDSALSGPVTIINPKQVTVDEAFKILQSVLSVRGFAASQDGNTITVTSLDKVVGSTPLLRTDPDDETKLDPRNQVMTQVIPLENVDATTLSKELTPLISKGANLIGSAGTNALILTDYASNIQRFLDLVDALDKASTNSEMRIYPLKSAEASAIADIINNLYKQITTRGRGGGQPGQPGMPMPPQIPGQPGADAGGASRPAVVAVPDTRTNSVIVVASADTQEKIATTIIKRLDDDDSNTLGTHLRKIKYANAVDIANLVNTVLTNAHGSAGSGSSSNPSFQSRAFGGFNPFFGGGFGGGNNQQQGQTVTSSDPLGQVTADPRTNSVLITATTDRMSKIEQLIDKLDVDVPVETTTFVVPLKNAQADDVAYALSQAFQTSNQNGSNNTNFFFGGSGQGSSGITKQKINRRIGQSNNNGFGRSARRSLPPGPPNAPDGGNGGNADVTGNDGSAMPQGIPGVMTPQGFVPTSGSQDDASRQAFRFGRGGGFFGGFGGGQTTSTPQYGRGSNGSYSNLLQLQGNVYVTPSPNGDGVIVTTTPDNYKAVMDLIEALDVPQRQVLIEVIVAEVTLDRNEKLGFNLNAKFTNLFGKTNSAQAQINNPPTGFGSTFDPTVTGAQAFISSTNYSALVQALTTDDKVRVISTPRVFTSNNQEADIEITQKIPYITGSTSSGLVNTNISNTIDFLPVGFILNVTPRISRQGLVTIDVQQEASDLLRFDTLGTGQNAITAPETNDRYTDTSVTAMDGETVVIGGMIRDSKSLNITKTPILSEIPIIGQFFRSRETVRNKVELMIFLTPHVVNSVQEARELTRKQGMFLLPELPDLGKQQPNLDVPLKKDDKSKKVVPDTKPMPQPGSPTDSSNTSPNPMPPNPR